MMIAHTDATKRARCRGSAKGFSTKQLDGGVEGGRHSDEHAQHSWIGGVDIVEMDDIGSATQQFSHGIGTAYEYDDGHEDEQVGVGENVDELRDGVVRRDALQQVALTNPPLRNLVMGHLDPYGVDGVSRYLLDVGNNDALATNNIQGVESHIGQCVGQRQAIGCHHEVIVLRIVVGGREGDGIELVLRQVPCIW